jgi:carboxyl-terminal processing protease
MKSSIKIVIIIIISLLIGIAIGTFEIPKYQIVPTKTSSDKARKIADVLSLINKEYVDKIDLDSLSDDAIRSLLEDLDPHSVYFTKEQIKHEQENLDGNFEGVGIQFRIIDDTIVVIQPVSGGPSSKVGIMAGDRIVKVNDTLRIGKLTSDDVFKLLKGKKNTTVKLSVKRQGINKPIDFVVKRDVIETHSVDYFGMLNSKTGYIKLSQFSANAHSEVAKAISDLKQHNKMTQLIFDLRGNGGGYLNQAIDIADEFLPKGDLIVFTKGRASGKQESYATDGGFFEKGKLVILIDEVSASASEILAGAIQDNDRGMIIGRRTFGKGLVQQQLFLPDGSAVRLTISRYYTPSGRCVQRPYILGDPEKYYAEFIERYANMESHSDTTSHSDSLRYKTKAGRFVYGGGGIEPDVELPYYNYKKSDYYTNLLRKGLIYKYCFDYADSHRKELSKYHDGQTFLNSFIVNKDIYNGLLTFADKNDVKRAALDEKERSEIGILIKAYIAQTLYDDKYFYPLFLMIDEDLQRALQHIK